LCSKLIEADRDRDPHTPSESHSHTTINLFVGILTTPEASERVMCYLTWFVWIRYSSVAILDPSTQPNPFG
jgi:hypothetical protein